MAIIKLLYRQAAPSNQPRASFRLCDQWTLSQRESATTPSYGAPRRIDAAGSGRSKGPAGAGNGSGLVAPEPMSITSASP